MFAGKTGILIAADVEPRPSIEATSLDVSDVIGDQIVSQPVAFIHGAPELAGCRIDGETNGIADACYRRP